MGAAHFPNVISRYPGNNARAGKARPFQMYFFHAYFSINSKENRISIAIILSSTVLHKNGFLFFIFS